MDARSFREELERQNAQFEAAMKTLESLGNVGIDIPDETLRAIDEACTPRVSSQPIQFINGVRA
jgi:hypothetical protein